MAEDKLVYQTGTGRVKPQAPSSKKGAATSSKSGLPAPAGPLKMRLERKGGGRVLTVIFNLPFDGAAARLHLKALQQLCASGATFKNGQIELQGDARDKAETYFTSHGITIKRAGG
jgi:translation initiation factor 1